MAHADAHALCGVLESDLNSSPLWRPEPQVVRIPVSVPETAPRRRVFAATGRASPSCDQNACAEASQSHASDVHFRDLFLLPALRVTPATCESLPDRREAH